MEGEILNSHTETQSNSPGRWTTSRPRTIIRSRLGKDNLSTAPGRVPGGLARNSLMQRTSRIMIGYLADPYSSSITRYVNRSVVSLARHKVARRHPIG